MFGAALQGLARRGLQYAEAIGEAVAPVMDEYGGENEDYDDDVDGAYGSGGGQRREGEGDEGGRGAVATSGGGEYAAAQGEICGRCVETVDGLIGKKDRELARLRHEVKSLENTTKSQVAEYKDLLRQTDDTLQQVMSENAILKQQLADGFPSSSSSSSSSSASSSELAALRVEVVNLRGDAEHLEMSLLSLQKVKGDLSLELSSARSSAAAEALGHQAAIKVARDALLKAEEEAREASGREAAAVAAAAAAAAETMRLEAAKRAEEDARRAERELEERSRERSDWAAREEELREQAAKSAREQAAEAERLQEELGERAAEAKALQASCQHLEALLGEEREAYKALKARLEKAEDRAAKALQGAAGGDGDGDGEGATPAGESTNSARDEEVLSLRAALQEAEDRAERERRAAELSGLKDKQAREEQGADAEKKATKAKAELASCAERIAGLEAELLAAAEKSKMDSKTLEGQLEVAMGRVAELQSSLETFAAKEIAREQHAAADTSQAESAAADLAAATRRVADLEALVVQAEDKSAKETKTLEGQLAAAVGRVAELQSAVETLTAAAADRDRSSGNEVSALAAKLSALTEQFSAQQSRCSLLERAKATLEGELSYAQNQVAEERRKVAGTADKAAADSQASSMRMDRLLSEATSKAERAAASLTEKTFEVEQLKAVIGNMRGVVSKSTEEVERYKNFSNGLEKRCEHLEQELTRSKQRSAEAEATVLSLSVASGSAADLQAEMTAVASELERAVAAGKMLESELDAARAREGDALSRLAAAGADLDNCRADLERANTAFSNIQMALENFQSERDSELELLERTHQAAIDAERDLTRTKVAAMMSMNDSALRDLRSEAKASVEAASAALAKEKERHEAMRVDNVALRRSLDEAIKRLQVSQEDIVDRSLMKNMLLDWHGKTGEKKKQVMQVLASLLHFTDSEKDKAGLSEAEGVVGRVVGAVAAPLPPPSVNVDKLGGDTVGDKFINFLLAETGDL